MLLFMTEIDPMEPVVARMAPARVGKDVTGNTLCCVTVSVGRVSFKKCHEIS